jgi:putative membrane protein
MSARHALWSTWSYQPLPEIAAAALVYSIGLARLWRKRGGERAVTRWQAAAFFGGLLAVAGALVSPIHHAGDQILSAHMLQHLVLILVAAPLLVLGRPQLPFLLALPHPARRAVHAFARRRTIRAIERAAMAPAAIWIIAVAVLWSWHVPALYDAAVRNQGLHTLEHLSFLAVAFMFWWTVLPQAGNRLQPGHDVLYVFTAGMASGALGALFTFATSPIYPTYVPRALALGVSPLSDQQLAGLLMWIPAGIVYLALASWLFVRWLRLVEAEARAKEGSVRPRIVPSPERDPILTGRFTR